MCKRNDIFCNAIVTYIRPIFFQPVISFFLKGEEEEGEGGLRKGFFIELNVFLMYYM